MGQVHTPASLPPGEVVKTADQRVVLHGVPWSHYQVLLALRGDAPVPRLTYLSGELELMSPSRDHERIKKLIARLLEVYALAKKLPLNGFGSWTLRDAPGERGAEPDECYVLGDARGRDRPDLAIEVLWTSGALDKLAVYAGLAWAKSGSGARGGSRSTCCAVLVKRASSEAHCCPTSTSRCSRVS